MDLHARRQLIEKARVFLRQNDFVFGYFPQLVMAERASEQWSLFWYFVRRLDDLLDAVKATSTRATGEDRHPMLRLMADDAGAALKLFVAETAGRVPRRLIKLMYQSTKDEQLAFSDGRAPAAGPYLRLIERKTVVPARICACLNGLDLSDPRVDTLVVSIGRGLQLLDDLFDIVEDRRKGRHVITREELSLLGLQEHEIEANLERVSRLRSQWILAAIAPAYDVAHQMADNDYCLSARSSIESVWKLIADGKAVPLTGQAQHNGAAFAQYLGVSTLPFDVLPATEQVKRRIFHPLMVTFFRGYRVFDASRLGELRAGSGVDLGPLLELLGPGAGRAVPVAEAWGRQDSRRLVDPETGASQIDVDRELSRIFLAAGTQAADDVLVRLHRDDAAAVAAHLLERPVADWQAVVVQDVDRGSEAVRAALAPDPGIASRLVGLGLDCVSLAVEHGLAFQDDLLRLLGSPRCE